MPNLDPIEFEELDETNCTKVQDIINAINLYLADLYERVKALEEG